MTEDAEAVYCPCGCDVFTAFTSDSTVILTCEACGVNLIYAKQAERVS